MQENIEDNEIQTGYDIPISKGKPSILNTPQNASKNRTPSIDAKSASRAPQPDLVNFSDNEELNLAPQKKKFFSLKTTLIAFTFLFVALTSAFALWVYATDPFNILARRRDAQKQENARILLNAIDEFYSIHRGYPWTEYASQNTDYSSDLVDSSNEVVDWLNPSDSLSLVNTSGLDRSFVNNKNLSSLKIFYNVEERLVRICFIPESSYYQTQAAFNSTAEPVNIPESNLYCLTDDYSKEPEPVFNVEPESSPFFLPSFEEIE